jgi:hypothetical protein
MTALRATSSASSAFCGAKRARSLKALPLRQASPGSARRACPSVRVQALFGGNKS